MPTSTVTKSPPNDFLVTTRIRPTRGLTVRCFLPCGQQMVSWNGECFVYGWIPVCDHRWHYQGLTLGVRAHARKDLLRAAAARVLVTLRKGGVRVSKYTRRADLGCRQRTT